MPLYFRGHHVTAKEYRLAKELVERGEWDFVHSILTMTPEEWPDWWNANMLSEVVTPGCPDDSWGGPYAAAVYRSQEAIREDANKAAMRVLTGLLADAVCLRPHVKKRPPAKPKRKPRRKQAST